MAGAANAAANGAATWVPYLVAINIGVGLLVAWAIWAFRSGRWVEEQTNAHAELQRQIDGLREEVRRDVKELKEHVAEEHRLRREFTDRVNVAAGRAETLLARHDERLKTLEAR